MNCFNILGIPYDSDYKIIKSTYAKLLKIHNPEEDPKGYQELRQAYDEALKYCEKRLNILKKDKNILDEDVFYNENNEHEQIQNDIKNYQQENSIEKDCKRENELYNQVDTFVKKLNEIYNDISIRIQEEVWKNLLDMPVLWNIEKYGRVNEEIFKFLSNSKYLPANIWRLLDENFKWSLNEIKLYESYDNKLVDKILDSIRNPSLLSYNYLPNIECEKVDKYLEFREKAYNLREEIEEEQAKEYLFSAYEIFDSDPEVLRLMGEYYCRNDKCEDALECYIKALKINEMDLESSKRAGHMLLMLDKEVKAIQYLEKAISYNSEDEEALYSLGICYYNTDNLILAQKCFVKLTSLKSISYNHYFKNIKNLLKGKKVKKIKLKKVTYSQSRAFKQKRKKKKRKVSKESKVTTYMAVFIILIFTPFYLLLSLISKPYRCIIGKIIKQIKIANDLIQLENNTKVEIYLKNVKPLNYYKIDEINNKSIILSEKEIDKRQLWGKVKNRIYSGNIDDKIVIFSDYKFSLYSIDKDGRYKLSGISSNIDNKLYNDIISDYEFDEKNCIMAKFIDRGKSNIHFKRSI